jgi:hypothetical protein
VATPAKGAGFLTARIAPGITEKLAKVYKGLQQAPWANPVLWSVVAFRTAALLLTGVASSSSGKA